MVPPPDNSPDALADLRREVAMLRAERGALFRELNEKGEALAAERLRVIAAERDAATAFQRGAEAMREACRDACDECRDVIDDLPLPEDDR